MAKLREFLDSPHSHKAKHNPLRMYVRKNKWNPPLYLNGFDHSQNK